MNVAINYLQSEEKARKVAETMKSEGVKALLVRADVRQAAQVKEMLARVLNSLARSTYS